MIVVVRMRINCRFLLIRTSLYVTVLLCID